MSEPTVPVPTAEEIVAGPLPGAADLENEIKQAAQPFGKLTIWLGVLAVVALAFAGGAWTHSALADGSTSAATPARTAGTGTPGQAGAGTPGQAGQGRPGGGGPQRGTTGTVDRVDGTTVYVKTLQGTEVAVSTSDSTTVVVTQPGSLSDLKAGADIVVQGTTGSDGTVTAQSITQQPVRGG
jgi:hypothetical protein